LLGVMVSCGFSSLWLSKNFGMPKENACVGLECRID